MSDWLHNLPILWMTLIVFGLTYLITAAIQGARHYPCERRASACI
jgi:hypothetical protein